MRRLMMLAALGAAVLGMPGLSRAGEPVETPSLADDVQAGRLPPVAQRHADRVHQGRVFRRDGTPRFGQPVHVVGVWMSAERLRHGAAHAWIGVVEQAVQMRPLGIGEFGPTAKDLRCLQSHQRLIALEGGGE